MQATLRTRLADLEARICNPATPDADRPQLLRDLEALRRVLARGGR